jgi:hypothetical protein
MITSILLLSALTLAQGPDRADWQLTPQLSPGLELVYSGTYVEETLIPHVQHQRQYALEANLLVLEAGVKDWQVAIMTGLTLQDGVKHADKKDGPASVRLEMARVDWQGRVRNQDKKLLTVLLKGPPTLEFGCFVPAPLGRVNRNSNWQAEEEGLPTQRWHVAGTEACGGVTCIKIQGTQQSSDWDVPRADQTAWRRRDTLWIHPQLSVAQKVERVIERRDPAREAPTARTIVRYELDSRIKYPSLWLEERRKEIAKVTKFNEDTQPLLRQPGLHRPQIDTLLQRVSFHLDHQPATQPTPYRKAALHIKMVLEKAQKGETLVAAADPPPSAAVAKTLGLGERVSDFAISSFTQERAARLQEFSGKPLLIFYYNPATPLGKEVLVYVKRLSEKKTAEFGVMAMAVTSDAEVARKQHQDLKLAFPLLDGNGMRFVFGAMETPHFVVLDGAGIIRLNQTGWGIQTPYEIEDVLRRLKN